MAGNIADYAENKVLDHMLGTGAWAMPTIYIALYTSDPTDADVGTEVSGGNYARQTAAFVAAAAGATDNSGIILFPQATADWGTLTHVGIRDALVAGNLLWQGILTVAKTIGIGDQFRFPVGALDVSLD